MAGKLARAVPVLCLLFLIQLSHSQAQQPNQQRCNLTNAESWARLETIPGLKRLIESNLVGQFADGGNSFIFVNWQDRTLRLPCPHKDSRGRYKWTQYCHTTIDRNKTGTECTEFNAKKYSSYQLITPSPESCGEYEKPFRTYICETLTDHCQHYAHVVIRPLSKAAKEKLGDDPLDQSRKFWCEPIRCKTKDADKDSIFAPFKISWRGPNGQNVEEMSDVSVETVNDFQLLPNGSTMQSHSKSIISINTVSPANAGIYECILTSIRYDITSTPDDLRLVNSTITDVYLKSGIRSISLVHNHWRPSWYIWIPVGVIGILGLMLPVMIRFCPTNDEEADIDNDDDEKDTKRTGNDSECSGGSKGSLTEEDVSLNRYSFQAGEFGDNKKDT